MISWDRPGFHRPIVIRLQFSGPGSDQNQKDFHHNKDLHGIPGVLYKGENGAAEYDKCKNASILGEHIKLSELMEQEMAWPEDHAISWNNKTVL